jgi:hypothetical protein
MSKLRSLSIDEIMKLEREASQNPGSWVYQIDGNYDDKQSVPPYAIIAAWEVSGDGQLSGKVEYNPNYDVKRCERDRVQQ